MLDEAQVLRPIDPRLDKEEWPLFELMDATVSHLHRRKQMGKLVDLLEVHLHGPFRVKGRLRKLKKDQESLALSPSLYSEELVIARVATYSLEIKDDGKIVIWALGGSGWYALSPSKAYKPIFQQMVEKTIIWLFLEDRYTDIFEEHKELKDTTALLYKNFSQENPTYPDAKAASELFHKYHEWLIIKMLVPEEAENWARTPIHTEMFERYPDEVSKIQKILKRRAATNSTVSDGEIFSNLSTDGSQSTIPVKQASPPSQTSAIHIANPISLPRSIRSNSKSKILWTILEKSMIEDNIEPKGFTLTHLYDLAYKKIDFKDKNTAMDVIKARAPDLEILMKDNHAWRGTVALTELQSLQKPPRYTAAINHKIVERSVESTEIKIETTKSMQSKSSSDTRSIPDTMEEGLTAEEDDVDEESESESESETAEKPKSSKGKSVLRPRASIIPLEPSSPLQGRGPTLDDLEDEEMPDMVLEDEPESSNATTSKRGAEEDTNTAERLTKRMRSLQAQSSASLPDIQIDSPPTGKPPIKIGKMPPTTSNRPGGLWMCSLDGCKHKVYKADTPEGILQVEQHYESHSLKMKDAMDTVARETENARGIYAVDHLLAKIEEMAKRWAERRPPV
ncbi:hypothetical protein DFH27DRAFT_531474 [Peziza echinospora]|nr:hypothetical protein DFH27DRAFT_531474 [Peziza echinospora]